MGRAGRQRVAERFSLAAFARRLSRLVAGPPGTPLDPPCHSSAGPCRPAWGRGGGRRAGGVTVWGLFTDPTVTWQSRVAWGVWEPGVRVGGKKP